MSVTQQNIADRLGLSKKSVVRALSGQGKVSDATRHLVLETAREMGYHPNSNPEARILIARRYGNRVQHGVIGFCLPSVEGRLFAYYLHLLQGMRQGAQAAGVELMLLDMQGVPAWSKVDGFIGYAGQAYLPPDHALHSMPRVALLVEQEGVPSVEVNDFEGGKIATEHLMGLGHRRIGFLVDLADTNTQALRRVNGYRAALSAAGIKAEAKWIGPLHSASAQFLPRGRDSMTRWLHGDWKKLGCTALLVHNDRAAMGVLEALHTAGIRVPEDVSVIGFDSTDECELVRPSLTSVRVPLEEVGACAVAMLVRQINEEDTVAEKMVLPVTLEVRKSTAPPRK